MMTLHAFSWLWPAGVTTSTHPVRAMLDQLSGLPVLGWEASCRLSARGIETGRLLAGIERNELSAARWGKLLNEIALPEKYRQGIVTQLPIANRVYFACEYGARSVTHKLYLESDDGFRHTFGERLTILGYKWNDASSKTQTESRISESRITEYWTQDRTDVRSSVALLQEATALASLPLKDTRRALELVIATLTNALSIALTNADQHNAWQHQCMNVREDHHPRASFAFNFYDSGMRVGKLRETVSALSTVWALPSAEIDQLFNQIEERELAWLAGGLGSDGEPFLTIYCVASHDDAMQACFAADETLWGTA